MLFKGEEEKGSLVMGSLNERDLPSLKAWRNAQMEVLRQERPLTDADQLRWFQAVREDPDQHIVAFRREGELIGYGGIVHIDQAGRTGELSFLVSPERASGDEYDWDLLHGCELMAGHAFRTLRLNSLTTETFDFRERQIGLLERFGFAREGWLRGGKSRAGKQHGSVLHRLTKARWERMHGAVTVMIQARMASSRLPGKVLTELDGKPLLWYVVRQSRLSKAGKVAVLTTDLPEDDGLATFAASVGADCYRGSEEDVLLRFHGAAGSLNAEVIVRVTGDCPLIDPTVVNTAIDEFKKGECDYLHTSGRWPDGLDVEVFSMDTLERLHRKAERGYQREHVTRYIHDNPAEFVVQTIEPDGDFSDERWTVDEPRDLEMVEGLLKQIGGRPVTMAAVLEILDAHPELREINRGIMRNEGLAKSREEEQ